MTTKTSIDFTERDLFNLSFTKEKLFDALIVLTKKGRTHDSGFGRITVVGEIDDIPIGVITRNSDDFRIIDPLCMISMEALPKSGAFRFHYNHFKFKIGNLVSTLYVKVVNKNGSDITEKESKLARKLRFSNF